jgi:PPP family 3-phenylpropionic acid transporter
VSGRLLTLRVYYLASYAALGAYGPFFARWLVARGVEGLSMGLIACLVPAMGVLGPPAVGLLADILGLRGSLLRVACGGACLAMGALAMAAASDRALSFGVIFAAVLFYAAFRSPMVMLADVVALERARGAGTTYGKIRLWGSLGFLGGVLFLGRAFDPAAPVPLPASVAAFLAAALVAAWTLPAKPATPRLPVAREASALLAAPDFSIFLGVAMLANAANASYDLCFSLHLHDLHVADAGTGSAWAMGVLFEVALMAFAEPLVARFSPARLLLLALVGATARWTLLAGVRFFPLLLALQPLHAVSFGLWWVASLAYVKERAPAHALATAQGLFSAAVAAGSVAGMLVWGTVYRRVGGTVVFGAAAAVSLTAGILAASWSRRVARAQRVQSADAFPGSASPVPAVPRKTFAPPRRPG